MQVYVILSKETDDKEVFIEGVFKSKNKAIKIMEDLQDDLLVADIYCFDLNEEE